MGIPPALRSQLWGSMAESLIDLMGVVLLGCAGLLLFAGGALVTLGVVRRRSGRTAHLSETGPEAVLDQSALQKQLAILDGRFKTAQRLAGLGNWEYHYKSDSLWWSDEVYRIFGQDPETFIATSDTFIHMVHPEDRKKVHTANVAALTERQPYDVVHRIVLADGSERVVHERAEIMRDDDDAATVMVGTIQDVTDQRRDELALQRVTAEQDLILENTRIAIVLTKGREIVRASRSYENLFGWGMGELTANEQSSEEPVTEGYVDLGFPDEDNYREFVREADATLTQGGTYSTEREMKQRDGRLFWCRIAGRHVNPGIPEMGAVWLIEDISERKMAEHQLNRLIIELETTVDRLNLAQKIASLGYYNWNLETDTLWFSAGNYEVYGVSPETFELSIDSLFDLIHPDDRGTVRARIKEAIEKSGTYEGYHRVVLPHGGVRIIHALGEVVYGEDGKPLQFNGTAQNVTERKQAEDLLRVAKDQAEEANRSKTEFLANISHELRTPLNSIIGFTDIMREEIFGPIKEPKYLEYAADVNDSGRHLLSLINDVLDVSVIESGNLVLDETPTDVGPMVDTCRRIIVDRATRAGIHVTTDLKKPFPLLQVDERRIKQILLNLLSNAVKFTPEGGTVTLTGKVDGNGAAVFQVSDTGIGIEEKDLEAVLVPFGQAGNTESRQHEGVGLGLPLSKSLAELHGGSLKIESTPGKGTLVTVRLSPDRTLNVERLDRHSNTLI
ncbi:MAG: PAS domain-containing protein [Rhodospirillales bacterium]|nr:PAS domain-containing protein [Rhodospirillales bacterium]